MKTIRSVGTDHPYITHAVITNSQEFGFGVFSWHTNKRQAKRNADKTNGRVVEVKRDGDGLYIIPPEATDAVNQFMEK